MLKKVVIAVVVVIIVLAGGWYYQNSKSVAPASAEPIKIGFIGPLTGFGAAWGEEQKGATEIAVDEINSRGGIGGQKVIVQYEDGKCTGKDSVSAAQKLINIDKIQIFTTSCSASSLAVVPVSTNRKSIQLAIWTTSPALSGMSDYVTRVSYSDDDTGKMMAETIRSKYKKVAIVTEMNEYSIGLRDSFKKYLGEGLYEENYKPEEVDMRTHALKVFSQKPEAILINPNSPETGLNFLKEVKKLGFKGQIYGNFFGSGEEVIKLSEAQGMIFFADPVVKEGSKKDRLFKEYVRRYGETPDFEFAVAAQYDAVYILKQAIEEVGYNPEAIKDYLHQLKDFNGVLGIYGFNDKGDAEGLVPAVKQIKDYKVVDYKD